MDERTYLNELGKLRGSRKNQILMAVNAKMEKENFGFNSEIEEMFFDDLMSEAETHVQKYGFWPVFEMYEIESDDPILDIYNSPVE